MLGDDLEAPIHPVGHACGIFRARGEGPPGAPPGAVDEAARGSAVATLRLGLSVLLRLFAPFLPYVCEEIWSWSFAAETKQRSIHRAAWPGARDFAGIPAPADERSLELAVAALGAIFKSKADAAVSVGREVDQLVISANAATRKRANAVLADVLAAARVQSHRFEESEELEEGAFAVREAQFAQRTQDA